jgi:hypothetical protein
VKPVNPSLRETFQPGSPRDISNKNEDKLESPDPAEKQRRRRCENRYDASKMNEKTQS